MNRWRQYLRPTWSGIIFGALLGCAPAILAAWALAAGAVSYQLRVGDRFIAARETDPLGYWLIVGVLLLAAFLLWGKTILDLTTLLRSHHRPDTRRMPHPRRTTPKA